MNKISKLWFYPFLIAAYPIVALLANNIQEVQIGVAVLPLLISLVFAGIVLVVNRLFLKNWSRAALLTSFILVLFFSYGHIYLVFEKVQIAGIFIGRHRILMPIYAVLFVFGLLLSTRWINVFQEVNQIMNVFAITAICISLLQIVYFGIQLFLSPYGRPEARAYVQDLKPVEVKPDIYFIVLDEYAREDVLQNDFGYDNQPFLSELKKMGFYVQDCSRTNYEWTRLSLGSTLNLNYIQEIGPEIAPNRDLPPLTGLIKDNLVRNLLKKSGYKIVSFETGFTWTEWYDADVYLAPPNSNMLSHELQPFTTMLTRRTALKIVFDAFPGLLQTRAIGFPHQARMDREIFKLAELGKMGQLSGPKFVFAQVIIPHGPFVFAPDGTPLTDPRYWDNNDSPIQNEFYRKGYVNQVQYINNQILPVLHNILADSKTPPVIILQGDHGLKTGENRVSNLSAFYLPGHQNELNSTMSPVNNFRLIFNSYFGTQYPILADHSYYSPDEEKFQLVEEYETAPDCINK
jgi:hypothetical protein